MCYFLYSRITVRELFGITKYTKRIALIEERLKTGEKVKVVAVVCRTELIQ